MKQRNPSIEILRDSLMFGICLLHSITTAGHNTPWIANALLWCVPCFMFISGWFGIKFYLSKIFILYGTSFYCAIVFVIFDYLFKGSQGGGRKLFDKNL